MDADTALLFEVWREQPNLTKHPQVDASCWKAPYPAIAGLSAPCDKLSPGRPSCRCRDGGGPVAASSGAQLPMVSLVRAAGEGGGRSNMSARRQMASRRLVEPGSDLACAQGRARGLGGMCGNGPWLLLLLLGRRFDAAALTPPAGAPRPVPCPRPLPARSPIHARCCLPPSLDAETSTGGLCFLNGTRAWTSKADARVRLNSGAEQRG